MDVKISFLTFAVLLMSFLMAQCNPIDIFTQLTDGSDKALLYRIAEYFDDYDDDSSYSGAVKSRDVSESQEKCRLPMRRGLCRALLPRWRYDPVEKKCIEFKFGG